MKNQSKDRVIWRILRYARPYTWWFALALFFIVITVGLELLQPAIIEEATNRYVSKYVSFSYEGLSLSDLRSMTKADVTGIAVMGLEYFLSTLGIMAFSYAQVVILAVAGQRIIYNIRTDIFSHMTRLHMGFYNEIPLGRLVTRVTNDCETVLEMFTSVITTIIGSMFVLAGVMGAMLHRHMGLSLALFSVIPIIALCTFIFTKVTRKMYRAIRAKVSDLNGFVAEHISGMKVVQIFTAEKATQDQFQSKTESLRISNLKQLMVFAAYSPVSYLMHILSMGILLVYGGKLVMAGVFEFGTLLAFQRYMSRFFEPIQDMAENFNIIQSASAAAERIFWLLDMEPAIKEDENPVHMETFKGRIEFKNVWFSYDSSDWVLRDVSFEVQPGQRVAFVGATGAGKTTIQNLICRYFDIQKGQILIDGVDVRRIKIEDLRRNIGQMLQDVFLFSGDVKGNIRLNSTEISDEEVVKSAKTVNAHDFITHLDGGYSHPVIQRGGAFSAGQRQLLSFARTLAFKPSMLILDEATANIDTETEALIQDALEKLMKGRTTIVVAHRLSTIQNSDKIIVMHKGKIREEGTHQELLAKGGIYYKLYKLQYE